MVFFIADKSKLHLFMHLNKVFKTLFIDIILDFLMLAVAKDIIKSLKHVNTRIKNKLIIES